jgi:hypothetical protein
MNSFFSIFRIFLITCIISILPSALSAQNTQQNSFFLRAGGGFSHLRSDRSNLTPVFLPAFGLGYSYALGSKTYFDATLQYSMQGGNTNDGFPKLRSHYLGFSAGPDYNLFDFINLQVGFEFNMLLADYTSVLDGSNSSGTTRYETSEYESQLGMYVGAGLQLQKGIGIGLQFHYPVTKKQFSNLQLFASFRFAELESKTYIKNYTDLNQALENYQVCQKLVLHREGITELSPNIAQLVNLQELFLDGNELKTLPKEIGSFEFLTKLSVRHNKLLMLPAAIGNLQNLEELYLEYNQLSSLPDEIGLLKNLRFLYIGKNYLKELPASIGELTNLIELDISNSGALLRIPPEIELLKNLELLVVDRTTVFPIPFTPPNARLKIVVKDNN